MAKTAQRKNLPPAVQMVFQGVGARICVDRCYRVARASEMLKADLDSVRSAHRSAAASHGARALAVEQRTSRF